MNLITPEGEWLSPTLKTGGRTFRYDNTLVRTFGPEFAELNHVEYDSPSNVSERLRLTPEFIELLIINSYPQLSCYHPDPQTIDWWVGRQGRDTRKLDKTGLPKSFSDQAG